MDEHEKSAFQNCPCASFSTSAQLISALSSNEQAERLIQWLQGTSVKKEGDKFEKIPSSEQKLCENSATDGQSSRCTRRVDVAYSILNAIRDACRIHLEKEQGSTDSKVLENVALYKDVPKYEESFPSLSASSQQAAPNILKPKKKVKKKIKLDQPMKQLASNSMDDPLSSSVNKMKVKRRIRPAQILTKQQSPWGDISNLQNDLTAANPWPAIITNDEKDDINPNVKSKAQQMKSSKKSMNIDGLVAPSTSNKDPMDRIMNGRVNGSLNIKKKDPMKRIMGDHASDGFQQKSMPIQNQITVPMEKIPSKSKAIRLISVESDQARTHYLKPFTQSTKETSIDATSSLRDNTVKAYSTIITSQLVPSIALELQLMLRLIAISDEDHNSNDALDNNRNLEQLFNSPENCRQFAAQVFKSLKNVIVNLNPDILLTLLEVRIFIEYVPEVATKIQQSLESHQSALLSEGKCGQVDHNAGLLVSGMNTILTTPFLEKRDSRHNYRSRDLSSMYNNREQCRDTFLFQLRAFQQMRGTVLNPTQIQRSLDGIKQALHQMMSNLLSSNIPWFTELFTDLLIQIGLVPTQELDADILNNVADKDRLQKLHSRFTSKVAQKNKSSKPLILRDASVVGPSPEHFFPGHQEFFFMFIKTMDSYSFNLYLQKRLVHMIMKMSLLNDSRGMEQRVRELQLLAKFLGLLAFSPNWYIKECDTAIFEYFTPVIPINSIIEDAYTMGNLVSIIPWSLNFLWMMSWDSISMQQSYYRDTFGMLRSIHRSLNDSTSSGYSHLSSNLLSIGLQLDTFFADVIGLAEVERLPSWKLCNPKYNENQDVLDASPLKMSTQYTLSTSTHLDDLHKLASDIANNRRLIKSSGASKKLKPNSLSSNTSSNFSITPDVRTSERFDSLGPIEQGKLQGFLSEKKLVKTEIGNGMLIDAFFHQHKHLQQLCEFVIDFSIEHILSKICLEDYIIPNVKDAVKSVFAKEHIPTPIDLDWYLRALQKIERDAGITLQYKCQRVVIEYISNAINSLVPPSIDTKIKDVAINLSVKHARRKTDLLKATLIRTQVKREMDYFLNQQKKGLQITPIETTLITFDRDIVLAIETLIVDLDESSKATSIIFHLSKDSIKKIETIAESLIFENNSCIFDASSYIMASSLLKILIRGTGVWMSPTNDSNKPFPGFRQIIDLASAFGSLGLASNEVETFGHCLSRPLALKQIVKWQIDSGINWFYDKCISGKLMKSFTLLNSLMSLLQSHDMSQDIAAQIMILIQTQRKGIAKI